MKKTKLFTIMLVLILAGPSCSNDKSDYEKARQANTVQAYEEFIQKHPESGFAELAQATIDSMRYEALASQDSLEAFKKFIREYPGSRFKAQVQGRIRQLELPDVAKRYKLKDDSKTLSAFSRNFLSIQGSSIHVDGNGDWSFELPRKGLIVGDLTFDGSMTCKLTILMRDKTLLADRDGIKAKDRSGTIWVSRETELNGKKVKAFFVSR